MKKKLVFATNNSHKLREIKEILSQDYDIISLADINIREEIPEDEDSIEGNAMQKARYIHEKSGLDCFADDTGLEVEALGGAPGVYSARYAGENASFEDNMDKLLDALGSTAQRMASFRTAIALIIDKKEFVFFGRVDGKILENKTGKGGFGYDPIFLPDGYSQSFAEMPPDEKNSISHRGRAVQKLVQFLNNYE
ncbi:MAG: non-canonical purine NTP diphosphatase [Bacteroidales bacterium]|nr:non-canonical purine NTP diphosphatase [Bacteroidales bacterium]